MGERLTLGDDPALHRYTTVYEGNGLRTCLTCMYSAARVVVFDPAKKVLRDIELTIHLQRLGKAANRKTDLGFLYLQQKMKQ